MNRLPRWPVAGILLVFCGVMLWMLLPGCAGATGSASGSAASASKVVHNGDTIDIKYHSDVPKTAEQVKTELEPLSALWREVDHTDYSKGAKK